MEATIDQNPRAVTNVCPNGHVSETVIGAVATATGTDPLQLEPLYAVVDPDALDRLVRSSAESRGPSLEIRFTMAGCRVTVRADGDVAVAPPPTTDAAPTTDESGEA
ncbi:HalOD1 output domain-containing protein [Halosimplex aquaticum]